VQNDSLRINDTEKYVTKLVLMIDSVAKDDFEKVKMIYDALTLLLDYDIEGLTNHSEISSEWDDVLVSKKAVCAGYAATFKKLCDLLKIPCEIVHGYARGLTSVSSNEELVPNHAWKIVKIKDFW
jgi:transglutaminase/protease-like cytokinesis protein 3